MLLYLNRDWPDNAIPYSSQLSLSSSRRGGGNYSEFASIAPKFNRLVVIDTEEESNMYGHPEMLMSTPDISNKFIAVHYFTVI